MVESLAMALKEKVGSPKTKIKIKLKFEREAILYA